MSKFLNNNPVFLFIRRHPLINGVIAIGEVLSGLVLPFRFTLLLSIHATLLAAALLGSILEEDPRTGARPIVIESKGVPLLVILLYCAVLMEIVISIYMFAVPYKAIRC